MTRTTPNVIIDFEKDWEARVASKARREAAERFHAARVPAQFQPAFDSAVETVLRTVRGATHSERQAALMVRESAGPAIILLDDSGKIVFWNRGAELLYGYGSLEVTGENYAVLWHREESDDDTPARALRLALCGARNSEVWQVRQSGIPFCAQTVLTPLYSDSGENGVTGYAYVVRDATREFDERKRLVAELAAEKQRAQKSERIAHLLETSFLPEIRDGVIDGFHVSTFYAAALEEANIGGDFFDAFRLRDGSSVFVVGDASGKGLEAAGRAAEVRFLLRASLRELDDACPDVPAHALARVNRLLCDGIHLDKLSMDKFTSVTLAVFHEPTGRLLTATAGGEPPCHIDAEGAATLIHDGGGPVLGVLPDAPYQSAVTLLAPGESVLLYTDGLTEARQKGDLFGTDGIIDVIQSRRVPQDTPDELGQALLAAASLHAGNTLRDDVCLLVVKKR